MAKRKILVDGNGDRLAAYRDQDLVPDSIITQMFSVTRMTLYRWARDPQLAFPASRKIRGMNYRKAGELRHFRDNIPVTRLSARNEVLE